jgi:hypothetical protein
MPFSMPQVNAKYTTYQCQQDVPYIALFLIVYECLRVLIILDPNQLLQALTAASVPTGPLQTHSTCLLSRIFHNLD